MKARQDLSSKRGDRQFPGSTLFESSWKEGSGQKAVLSVNTYSRTNRMTHPSIIPPSVTHAPY